MSEFVNGLKTQVSWLELKKHLAKEYGHIIDDQDAQYKLNNVQKQPGQQIWQYIKDIDDTVEHMSDKPDSQIKAAFIRGLDDNTLVRNFLSKPSFTFDDCTKYALEYEQTEDRLGTHKKNTGITVNSQHKVLSCHLANKSTRQQLCVTIVTNWDTEPVNVLCQLKNY